MRISGSMHDQRRRWAAGIAALVVLAGCGTAPTAPPSPTASAHATPLPSGVSIELSTTAIAAHLAALEAIAEANEGVRTVATPGYTASVDYVVDQLRQMGYTVTTPVVDFSNFVELPGSTIEVVGGPSFEGGPDFHAMIYSGGGDITAPVETVGFPNSDGGEGNQGCDPSDFDAFPAGAIALSPPGPCFRRRTVENAQAAGAVALVVAYPQWQAGEARRPTLLSPDGMEIPALSATGAVGEALHDAAADDDEVRLRVEVRLEPAVVHNVVAETPGDPSRVAMLGAHLDSVHDGPGINDNGSGVAALLEIARSLAGGTPNGRVRFGFWAAEEFGAHGSQAYVGGLPDAERQALVGYLNLDMLGSPNAVPFVYDDSQAPAGSDTITDYLGSALEASGAGAERKDLGGGSDHAPFAASGIATGGIFSGATEVKTAAQAARFGGQAGEQMDACYHLACDTQSRVNVAQVALFGSVAAEAARALANGDLVL
jgi:Zn-dependent M28 family amino/carboxypeptidase